MDIRFLGHSCFELSEGDTRILIDPFLTGNPKAAVSAARKRAGSLSASTADWISASVNWRSGTRRIISR